jgi:16S rRNA pseudouridine516 synthase
LKTLPIEKILQSQGYGSRKWCRDCIENGDFRIDGQVFTDPKFLIDPSQHEFRVFEESFDYHERVYLILNKPSGYECSRSPTRHPGVLVLLSDPMRRREVQPVGRLDHDTTGLLLLSDDGGFIHRQSSPKHHVPKTYWAHTSEPIGSEVAEKLTQGVQLNDEPHPIAALSSKMITPHILEIVLAEGKYHQVKRMIAAIGNHCARLERVGIGRLTLANLSLPEGSWRHLSEDELALLVAPPL